MKPIEKCSRIALTNIFFDEQPFCEANSIEVGVPAIGSEPIADKSIHRL